MQNSGRRRRVTTVHPGGIRTRIATSARAAASVAAGDVESSLAFADKALRMPPERAARIILDAARRRKSRVVVGLDAKAVEKLPVSSPPRCADCCGSDRKGACVAEPHLDRTGDEAILGRMPWTHLHRDRACRAGHG